MMRRTTLLLVSMIVLLALPAYSSTAASPAPTAQAYEPPAVPKGERAVIMINLPASANDENVIERLNSVLESKDQHFSFQMRTSTFFTGGGDFLQKVKEELAAGKPAADAYALLNEESRTFFNDDLTMDVTELVKQYAPVYMLKYGAIFNKTLSGIPVGVYGEPFWYKTALMLSNDYLSAGDGVATTDGLFQFLDKSVAAQTTVLADPRMLVDQWALERGCYPLLRANRFYKRPGGLFYSQPLSVDVLDTRRFHARHPVSGAAVKLQRARLCARAGDPGDLPAGGRHGGRPFCGVV